MHDLHVWTLTSEMHMLTAHLSVADGTDTQSVLHAARAVLTDRFSLTHATLQVEVGIDQRCHDLAW